MKTDAYLIKVILVIVGFLCYLSPVYSQTNNHRRDSTQLGIINEPQPIDTISINSLSLPLSTNIRSFYPSFTTRSLHLPSNSQFQSHSSQLLWERPSSDIIINVPSRIRPDMSLDLYNMNFPRTYIAGFSGYNAIKVGQFQNTFIPLNYYYGSSTDMWIGLTSIHSKSAGLFHKSEKLYATINGNIMQYGHMGMPHNNMRISSSIEYSPNSWLTVGVFGNYAVNPSQDQNHTANHLVYGPYSPHSSYGAYAKIYFIGDFGVQATTKRYFDPMKRKWVTGYEITPTRR